MNYSDNFSEGTNPLVIDCIRSLHRYVKIKINWKSGTESGKPFLKESGKYKGSSIGYIYTWESYGSFSIVLSATKEGHASKNIKELTIDIESIEVLKGL